MQKKKVTSKKCSVSMKTTNGPIITAIGNGANITINERIIIGGIEHFKCNKCNDVHPKGHEHLNV